MLEIQPTTRQIGGDGNDALFFSCKGIWNDGCLLRIPRRKYLEQFVLHFEEEENKFEFWLGGLGGGGKLIFKRSYQWTSPKLKSLLTSFKTDVWGTIRNRSSKMWLKEHLISSGVFSGDMRTLILTGVALISDVMWSKYFRLNNVPWLKAGNNFIRTSKPAKITVEKHLCHDNGKCT